MQPGIPSASEMIRNLSQVTGGYEVLYERGEFRVVKFAKVIETSDFWVVNDKGFFLGASRFPPAGNRLYSDGNRRVIAYQGSVSPLWK